MSAVNVHTKSFGLSLIIVRCCCVKQTRMGVQVNRSVFFLCNLFITGGLRINRDRHQ